jgi:hypothetical protein
MSTPATMSAGPPAAKPTMMRDARGARSDTDELFLGPLHGFVGDEFSKVCGGTREHRSPQIGEAFLHIGIGKSGIDRLVELLDNLRGRGFGHDDPVPGC